MATKLDYLKKYVSKGESLPGEKGDKPKKKKKKKIKVPSSKKGGKNFAIFDDDVDWRALMPVERLADSDGEEDDPEDKPVVAEVRDETVVKWQPFGSSSQKEDQSPQPHDSPDMSPPRKGRHDSPDPSPPRRKRHDSPDMSPPRRKRHDSPDMSPPRKKRHDSPDMSPPRRKRHDSPDMSPPRKKRHDSPDMSPPRRKRHDSPDMSPPRRKQVPVPVAHDDDLSPPRKAQGDTLPKNNTKSNTDLSPPRRRRHDSPDLSPPRRNQGFSYDNDLSPPRKGQRGVEKDVIRKRHDSPDMSPPRRKRHDSPDMSPPRGKQAPSRDDDLSPPRKGQKYAEMKLPRGDGKTSTDHGPPGGRRHDSPDMSPPRRRRHDSPDISPPRKPHPHSSSDRQPVSDHSLPQKRKTPTSEAVDNSSLSRPKMPIQSTDRPSSHPRMASGKKAGLQNAEVLRQENAAARERETELLNKMDTSQSGRGAETVYRDKEGHRINLKLERLKRMQEENKKMEEDEKFMEWGKGVATLKNAEEKLQDDLYEMSKPLARYADDEDLERMLKAREREGDPMLKFIKKKPKLTPTGKPKKERATYRGSFPPNRFGIRPGYRWDGVDRSNGFEKAWFARESNSKATADDAYKWSVENM